MEYPKLKVGDKVVVPGGRFDRGSVGTVLDISGKCGGHPAVEVGLQKKRYTKVTFFPIIHLTKCA